MSIVRIQCTEIWAPPVFDEKSRDYADTDEAYVEYRDDELESEIDSDSIAQRYYNAIDSNVDLDTSTYIRSDRRPLRWLDNNPAARNEDLQGFCEPLEPRRRRRLGGQSKPTAETIAVYRNGGRYRKGRYIPLRSEDFRDRRTLQDWEEYLTYAADKFLLKKSAEEYMKSGCSPNVCPFDEWSKSNNVLFKTRPDSPPPMCSHEDPITGRWVYMGPAPGQPGSVYSGTATSR